MMMQRLMRAVQLSLLLLLLPPQPPQNGTWDGYNRASTLTRLADASIQYRVNNRTYTYPTYDMFWTKNKAFRRTGIMYNPQFESGSGCRLKPPRKSLETQQGSFAETIVALDEVEAQANHSCATVAQVAQAILEFGKSLEPASYPPVGVFVYFLRSQMPGEAGGPYTVRNTAHRIGIPDGDPALPTVLVPSKYYNEAVESFLSAAEPVEMTVIQEPGPWNKQVLSRDYKSFLWVLMAVNGFFIVNSIAQICILAVSRQLRWERRNLVVCIAIVSAALFVATLPMNPTTLLSITLLQTSSLLFSIAFYLLLLIWCAILQAKAEEACRYTTIGIQLTMASRSMLACFFLRKQDRHCKSQTTHRALGKASNSLIAGDVLIGSISMVVARFVLHHIGFTVRSIALLSVLGIRGIRYPDSSQKCHMPSS
ncbi:hypothetical protein THASP1DRAFT_22763 [Thamnocephalis sphaerospora]|uniref:G-protein coupled receptors family 3 profile domain-containing protein n=1 Tax=Thamnocephalis sphaerospora TaxID=78915 RepID=A0A4V1IX06_9FUNG|nr:hypothetical protein THASP1DRAFT_22763 [Thamnocephalis sphaerospora]|eukprot:RKP09389.1 hypothetical protein THASP1DRAFT_22763 [Thamnocephalis sphaerospora]